MFCVNIGEILFSSFLHALFILYARALFSFNLSKSFPLLTFLHRNYLSEQYPTIKKSNPELPILIREAFGVPPTLYARFEHGREAKYSLEGLSSSAIEQTLKNLK